MTKLASGVTDYQRVCQSIEPRETFYYSFQQQRQNYLNFFRAFPVPRPESILVEESVIKQSNYSIPLRIYRRFDAKPEEPCIVYIHGGGYLSGGFETVDSMAADLADRLHLTVITFQYRIAPEHQHPAALEDIYTTVQIVINRATLYRIDKDRVVLAGESCGGGFAAGIPLLIRDRGDKQVYAQVPINPIFNSHRWACRQATEYPLDAQQEMHHYTSTYLGDNLEQLKIYVSPLQAPDLSGLPKTFVWAAEIDPLADEARAFVRRLQEFKVPGSIWVQPGVVHGCLRARHHYEFARTGFEKLLQGFSSLLD